jgi:hypothetical protein
MFVTFRASPRLRAAGQPVTDADAVRLSPLAVRM